MKTLQQQGAIIFCATVALCFLYAPGVSAWSFSVAQQNTPAEFIMGTTQPVKYRVCNNSSGAGNETLQRVRFYLANYTYSTLSLAASPTGWNCTLSNRNHYVQCVASTAAYYIPAGTLCSQYMDFTFNVTSTAQTQDRTDKLSNVTARFSGSTTYRTVPAASLTPNSWTWKSFLMTLVPSTLVTGQSCTFTLTMTVTNKLSATNITNPNYVTSQPKPPRMTTLIGGTAATASVPADIAPLNAGLVSSMTWTYMAGAIGTLNFSAYAKDSTGIRTSSTVTTPTMTVNAVACGFIISSLTVTPNCLVSGSTATFTMVVSNTTGITLANVNPPAALVKNGTATIGAFTLVTGPNGNLATGLTRTFVWTAPVTANPADAVGQDYSVTGTATSTTLGYLTTNPATSNVQFMDGYIITISPTATNANSTYQELVWNVTNSACNSVNRVSITVPAGWPAPSDMYSEVDNGATLVYTWNYVSPAFSTPTFPVPDPANDLPNGGHVGTYYLLFSSPTPTTTGTYTFTTTITDTAGVSKVYNYLSEAVTVNPFDSSSPGAENFTDTNVWHEDIK